MIFVGSVYIFEKIHDIVFDIPDMSKSIITTFLFTLGLLNFTNGKYDSYIAL